jgi:hypothetical protein
MIPGINAWARTGHFIFNKAKLYYFLRMTGRRFFATLRMTYLSEDDKQPPYPPFLRGN